MRLNSVVACICILNVVQSKSLNQNTDLPIQAVSATGRLFCGEFPAIGIQVKLIDRDHGVDRDDLLDEQKTDEDGKFHVTGGTYEQDTIEPALKIYHDCNDGEQKCQKKLFWDIPSKYVSVDLYKIPVFNVGSINLELGFGNEKRDCKH